MHIFGLMGAVVCPEVSVPLTEQVTVLIDGGCVFISYPAVCWKSNTCDRDGVCAVLHPYIRDSGGRSRVSSLG